MFGAVTGPPRTPFNDLREAEAATRFGMWLFLIALAALFAATLMGYVVMYVQLSHRGQWPEDLPGVPGGLLLSTALLVVTSVALETASRRAHGVSQASLSASEAGAAAGDADGVAPMPGRVRRDLIVATALGLVFLVLQAAAWVQWLSGVDGHLAGSDQYRFALAGFWVLTGLHALHVVGGALPLLFETVLACRRPDTDFHRAGSIRFTAMYWHFLGGVWLVLYALLLITT